MINIALPKGRLGEKSYAILKEAGYSCPSIEEDNRKLIFINEKLGVCYFWAKPSDVSIYVEHGAADLGIAGKDILMEYEPDVFELLDLHMGKCDMCVAGFSDFEDDTSRKLRIATKFPKIASQFYAKKGREIQLIHLNGSIELAPIVGLSDVIVDIVETGKTLRENGLAPLERVLPISARLIANKSAYKFKTKEINELTERLERYIQL